MLGAARMPGDRADVDDRARVLLHPGLVSLLYPRERGDAVHLDDLACHGQVQLHHRAVRRVDTGVVGQQVHAAEGADRPLHHFSLMVVVVGPARDAERMIGATELGDGLLERLLGARRDHHPGAVGHQPPGDRQPDAPARTGDDSGP